MQLNDQQRAVIRMVAPWLLDDPQDVYRPDELAGRLAASRKGVYKMLHRSDIEFFRTNGRCILVPWKSLVEYYLTKQESQ